MGNAERQRRYIERLKARAEEPHGPDMVLAGLAKLKPIHFPGTVAEFARLVRAEADRLSPVSDATREIPSGVSDTDDAELNELARQFRKGQEMCEQGIDEERKGLLIFRSLSKQLIDVLAQMQIWYDEDTQTIEDLEAQVEALEAQVEALEAPDETE